MADKTIIKSHKVIALNKTLSQRQGYIHGGNLRNDHMRTEQVQHLLGGKMKQKERRGWRREKRRERGS